ncbi:MAG: winged helix-turn-helix transcriptional regulator [Kiritimatiellia bacterium]
MFNEMERAGCYPPRFDAIGGALTQVTLRNEPIYDRATLEWLKQFAAVELSGDQKRMLAYAHAHGDRFTSREYQRVVDTDIYGASNAIKDMIRKGVARSTGKRSRVYEVKETLKPHPDAPEELVAILPILQRNGCVSNADIRRKENISRNTAARILSELVAAEWLSFSGKKGLGARYYPGNRLLHHSPTERESRRLVQ